MENHETKKEFRKRLKEGTKSEKEQMEHVMRVRQKIAEHKYGVKKENER